MRRALSKAPKTPPNLTNILSMGQKPAISSDTGNLSNQPLNITPTYQLPTIHPQQKQFIKSVQKQETIHPENILPVFDQNISAINESYSYNTRQLVIEQANILKNRYILVSIIEVSLFEYYGQHKIKITKLPEYNDYNYTNRDITLNTPPSPLITNNQYILITRPTKIYIKKQEHDTYLELEFTS